ncbi:MULTISPECIES: hypothetical protein [unclassified Pseudomonas]|jgi:hypothetical protein|nr:MULTISPECIES: hypothetical protein [unclassified Pseudomonas]WLH79205.1 hypothetical protein PSH81_26420 [Pseudomonas sp. FP2335]
MPDIAHRYRHKTLRTPAQTAATACANKLRRARMYAQAQRLLMNYALGH